VNNWHRMIWTLDKPRSDSSLVKLFKKGASNEFWFEPCVDPASNDIAFMVRFKPEDMVADWTTCLLKPLGSVAFVTGKRPNAKTERLEGPITIGAPPATAVRVYLAVKGKKRTLVLRRGTITGGSPDTGGATAHN
jgi:hypothetical protein